MTRFFDFDWLEVASAGSKGVCGVLADVLVNSVSSSKNGNEQVLSPDVSFP